MGSQQGHLDCPAAKLLRITSIVVVVGIENPRFDRRVEIIHPCVVARGTDTFDDDGKQVLRLRSHYGVVVLSVSNELPLDTWQFGQMLADFEFASPR